ncbi:alanine racemase [Nocardia terpenica]|uniref:D-serine dehydratase-like domain-containing protein n=1 Tax=Nocardia terpenica TaxID=455432 RepID=A0A164MLR8_9NOCA|nr:alanine racemase [Nocardia terpenica]KZM73474.1 hypothetical protein AWN90_33140 [Nocardia terpenica]NQE87339.1 hypothetical protein [Nocardia terpenica]
MHSHAYPQLRLDVDAVDHNIRVMGEWCRARDVVLAPHVKTTMSAPIVDRQLAAGAVGVTVATVDQAAVLLGWGHDRILIANQVVDSEGLARLRDWLNDKADRQIRFFVDSPEGVAAAQRIHGERDRRFEVLLDVGTPGGRTGVRTRADARRLAETIARAPGLALVGVAGYEGVAPNTRTEDTLAAVDDHCRRGRDVYTDVAAYFDTDAPIFSMGGSAFPDRVVEFLPTASDVPGTVRLLRSGCYVTHDHGTYARVSPIPGLRPALSVRAVVLSAPEPGVAVVGAGKRDLAYDADLPVLLGARCADGTEKSGVAGTVRALYDQHAVLADVTGLAVTDIVEFGLSHPCSVFDRWPAYYAVDADGDVSDLWRTDFHRTSITSVSRPVAG